MSRTAFKYYPRYMAVFILRAYQKLLSFDHGLLKIFYPYGYCKFHPTCSQYAIDAVTRFGLFKGGPKALWRVLRCHPWSKGGQDPVREDK